VKLRFDTDTELLPTNTAQGVNFNSSLPPVLTINYYPYPYPTPTPSTSSPSTSSPRVSVPTVPTAPILLLLAWDFELHFT